LGGFKDGKGLCDFNDGEGFWVVVIMGKFLGGCNNEEVISVVVKIGKGFWMVAESIVA
jgi:hypothetical protein